MDEPTYPPPTVTPRTFFVPSVPDPNTAEKIWQGLRADSGFPTTDRRIQRLQYNIWRGVFTSEVGYLEKDDQFEWLTTAIFEPSSQSSPWTISIMRISQDRPVWRHPPILIDTSDVLEVTDFLAAESPT